MSYYWHVDQNEYQVEGPFDTIEECKEHLLSCFCPEDDTCVVLSTTKNIQPEEWADGIIDKEEILERMDERLYNDIAFEDQIFDIPQNFQKQAQIELDDIIKKWVIKHIITNGGWSTGDTVLQTSVATLYKEIKK